MNLTMYLISVRRTDNAVNIFPDRLIWLRLNEKGHSKLMDPSASLRNRHVGEFDVEIAINESLVEYID